ncbi:DUF5689 domain-containing protein [Aureivirga marina]|uniref:DUF5689 domain-containing protein n=1 Tax=Aureivirga marina TaxID=1182451 RepID=UPI0018CA73D5|nr:DUF5689 domain-containing protein [Aureivirga marina]
MKKNYAFLAASVLSVASYAQSALITGVVDSPCPNGNGKTVELYVEGTVDFTNWKFQKQTNANTDDFQYDIDLSSLGSKTDEYVYLTNDADILEAEFGINTGVLVDGGINMNGDDRFQIVDNAGLVIDRFGEDGVDGTGTAWEYQDTYAKRNAGTAANGGSFDINNWTIGEVDAFDDLGLCNSATALNTTFQFGTYTGGEVVLNPTLSIANPSNNATFGPEITELEVEFNLGNFNLSSDETAADGDGYIIWSMDDFSTSNNKFNESNIMLSGLTLGDYTLKIKLVDNDGNDLANPVLVELNFSIKAENQVASITELREHVAANGLDGFYEITGEVIISQTDSYKNRKWIQDKEDTVSGILIYDNDGIITTDMTVGDIVTGFKGQVKEFNGLLQLVPTEDAGSVVSNGNEVAIQTITVEEFNTNGENYESELVELTNVTFTEADGTAVYANGTNYDITDGANTAVLRTGFYDVDYIGQVLPQDAKNITGVAGEYNGTYQISPRNAADIVDALNVNEFELNNAISMYPNPTSSGVVNLSKASSYEVYDMLGRKVLEGEKANTINVSTLTKGSYVVRLEGTNAKLIVK